MQGRIVSFDDGVGHGVIAAENGRRFRFAKDKIVNPNGKLVGYEVDFVVESSRPQDIILLTGSPWMVFASRHDG
jgi:hypothetical protein